jgi:hypothetical protein
VQSREDHPYFLFSEGFGEVGELVEGLVVDDLRVAQTEDQCCSAVPAVFVDGLDDFVDVLMEVEEADRP